MIPEGTSPEAIVAAVVITTLFACVLMAALFLYRFPHVFWMIVNFLRAVMSRWERHATNGAPSVGVAEPRQTDRPLLQTAPRVPSRDVMLDIYRLLREYNVPREKARPVLKAAGWTLDNNLWLEAKPSEDEAITPIAQRRTAAAFPQDDPDLVYQPPN